MEKLRVSEFVNLSAFARHVGVSRQAVTLAVKSTLAPAYDGRGVDTTHPAAVEYKNKQAAAKTKKDAKSKAPPKPAANGVVPLPQRPEFKTVLDFVVANQEARASSVAAATGVKEGTVQAILRELEKMHVVSKPGGRKGRTVHAKPDANPTVDHTKERADVAAAIVTKDRHIEKYLDYTLREINAEFGTDSNFNAYLTARLKIEDIRVKQIKAAEAEGTLIPRDTVRVGVFGALENMNMRLLTDAPRSLATAVYSLARTKAPKVEAEREVADIIGGFMRDAVASITRTIGPPDAPDTAGKGGK